MKNAWTIAKVCGALLCMVGLGSWESLHASQVPAQSQPKPPHWAFVPPQRPSLPPIPKDLQARTPVDHFVLAKLAEAHVSPSPPADRVTLIRRLSLDLTGLPPSPEEVKGFERDERPDAYELLVERLLESPHYGERWGRWWLDLARYADSNGYSIDAPRSIWKYRDWVVQALNQDMPFNQFVVEQLAGDLLAEATLDQRIATGFNRNTQINQEGGIDPEQFRVESVFDRVDTLGSAFLGLTVGCAQCHDHKFDPITQRDYYQLFAFFNTTVPDGHGENQPGGALELPGLWSDAARKQPLTTLVMREDKQRRESVVFIKGDFTRRGDKVDPGFPAVFGPSPRQTQQPPLNRLDLARWVVHPGHPLTARVVVNRIWQQYFGLGIVETQNDFGTQGIAPSHPELLDWLALELIAHGWSLKSVHRAIVQSATYRQSSQSRPDLRLWDPKNKWLARQNRLRLDAEIVRDTALAASGLLDPTLGGPPVHPPQPEGVMSLGQSRRAWKVSDAGGRYRRGLYTFFWRATPYPALTVFDAPDAFSACTRRIRSNTPLQALTLLNDEQFYECAQALARRVLREGPPTEAGRLDFAFRLCLARHPAATERQRLLRLLEQEQSHTHTESHGEADAAWTSVARVLLNLDETITRE